MPVWGWAILWGFVVGSGLLLGATISYTRQLSHGEIARVMAFGGGVLIAVASLDLMEEAYSKGGPFYSAAGLLAGAFLFSSINALIATRGAMRRKRCGGCVRQPSEAEVPGSGAALVIGSVLDVLPEALAIGLSLSIGGAVSTAIISGFFLSNVPQGLSATSGMRDAGRSTFFIFGLWVSVTLFTGIFAAAGYFFGADFSNQLSAVITAVAAGAILALLAEVIIPEAFYNARRFVGVITVLGFFAAYVIIKTNV